MTDNIKEESRRHDCPVGGISITVLSQEEAEREDGKIDCQDCVFLSHYERNSEGKWELPRCSIEFRDGSKVKHPCKDKIKKREHDN